MFMREREMNVLMRTAPAVPAQAVATPKISLTHALSQNSGAARRNGAAPGQERSRRPQATPDFGPISRAEMREIILEMIG